MNRFCFFFLGGRVDWGSRGSRHMVFLLFGHFHGVVMCLFDLGWAGFFFSFPGSVGNQVSDRGCWCWRREGGDKMEGWDSI
jgi:hypothetical protein